MALASLAALALLRRPTYLEIPADPVLRAHRLVGAGLPEEAEKILFVWLDARLDDVGAHYEFLAVHFSVPRAQRDDAKIRRFYDSLRGSSTGHRLDVATYATGLYCARLADWQQALSFFDAVPNQDLPFLLRFGVGVARWSGRGTKELDTRAGAL